MGEAAWSEAGGIACISANMECCVIYAGTARDSGKAEESVSAVIPFLCTVYAYGEVLEAEVDSGRNGKKGSSG